MPKLIRSKIEQLIIPSGNHAERDGVAIDKGVVLTQPYLEQYRDEIGGLISYWTAYPDMFLDLIKPVNEGFTLFFFQRILLRAMMRFKRIFWIACRACSKTFITILALFLQCVFFPGTKRFICAPGKSQSAKIAKEKLAEIFAHWPLLRREVVGGDVSDMPGNYGEKICHYPLNCWNTLKITLLQHN